MLPKETWEWALGKLAGGRSQVGGWERGRWDDQHVQVAVSKAFPAGNLTSSLATTPPSPISQTNNFRVFNQVLFFIAESLR